MESSSAEISVKGQIVRVPSFLIQGHRIIVRGALLRIAEIFDEDWQSDEVVDPAALLLKLREQAPQVDLFTFAQKLPHTVPQFPCHYEWDNIAAIRLTTYQDWWERALPQATRKHVRKAQKLGVVVRDVTMDDALAAGLKAIYDESPIRQDRPFWHYGKPVEAVRRENSSYLDRSILLGAYTGDELIGFLKLVRVGSTAQVMQIIAKAAHTEKKITNALIAKGVEACLAQNAKYFVYGQYIYGGNTQATLTEFKRRNGFEMIRLPRYFLPLGVRGRLALATGLHRGARHLLPTWLDQLLRDLRTRLLSARKHLPATRLGAAPPESP